MTPELHATITNMTLLIGALALLLSGPVFIIGFIRSDERGAAGGTYRSGANLFGFVLIGCAALAFAANYFIGTSY